MDCVVFVLGRRLWSVVDVVQEMVGCKSTRLCVNDGSLTDRLPILQKYIHRRCLGNWQRTQRSQGAFRKSYRWVVFTWLWFL